MLFRSIVEGIEQRKCNFTFAKIIACGFAYLWIREIVEYVILYLEAKSEQFGILHHRRIFNRSRAGGFRSHFHAVQKEGCRFFADHHEIALLIEMMFAHIADLIDFTK